MKIARLVTLLALSFAPRSAAAQDCVHALDLEREELVVVDPRRAEPRRLPLPGSPRGVAVRHELAYVTVSGGGPGPSPRAGAVVVADTVFGVTGRTFEIGGSPAAIEYGLNTLYVADAAAESLTVITFPNGTGTVSGFTPPVVFAPIVDLGPLELADGAGRKYALWVDELEPAFDTGAPITALVYHPAGFLAAGPDTIALYEILVGVPDLQGPPYERRWQASGTGTSTALRISGAAVYSATRSRGALVSVSLEEPHEVRVHALADEEASFDVVGLDTGEDGTVLYAATTAGLFRFDPAGETSELLLAGSYSAVRVAPCQSPPTPVATHTASSPTPTATPAATSTAAAPTQTKASPATPTPTAAAATATPTLATAATITATAAATSTAIAASPTAAVRTATATATAPASGSGGGCNAGASSAPASLPLTLLAAAGLRMARRRRRGRT